MDDNLFERDREEFDISLSSNYFTFNVIPIVVAIQDTDGTLFTKKFIANVGLFFLLRTA